MLPRVPASRRCQTDREGEPSAQRTKRDDDPIATPRKWPLVDHVGHTLAIRTIVSEVKAIGDFGWPHRNLANITGNITNQTD